jgi:putative DNA primase/helicase
MDTTNFQSPVTSPCELPQIRIETEQLDIAGLHRVKLTRGPKCSVDHYFYLNDIDARDAFADQAVEKLIAPGEDAKQPGYEIRRLLREACWEFERSRSHLVFEPLSEARPYDVRWLWPDRIAGDKLTMLVGDPGVGKSLLSLDMAARVSTGRPWPDEPVNTGLREPGGVLLLSELDDPDDTIRPRLQALGADLSRIVLLRSFIRVADPPAPDPHEDVMEAVVRRLCAKRTPPLRDNLPFSVGGKLTMLADAIKRMGNCKLLIIDPLSAYIDSNYTRRQLNELMQELVEIAASEQVAILVVSHFSRGSHSLFHYGGQTNSRFVASARSVWKIVGDSEFRDRRLLLPLKNNLGSDWLGLGFRIESAPDDPAPRIGWEQTPLEVKAPRMVYEPEKPKTLPNSYALHRQMIHEWLRQQLESGERFAQEILAAAALARIGQRSLRLALREIGGQTRKGSTGLWVWSLENQSSVDFCANSELALNEKSARQVGQVDQVGRVGRLEAG